jgi:hypothetical protein
MITKENKKMLDALEKSKKFCEFFSSLNLKGQEALKTNLKTTACGLSQAIAMLEALDAQGLKL